MNQKAVRFNRDKMPYNSKGLGVFLADNKTYLFHQGPSDKNFLVDISDNGLDFKEFSNQGRIELGNGKVEDITSCEDFRVARIDKKFFLSYKLNSPKTSSLCSATSDDLIEWTKIGNISTPAETGMLLSGLKHQNQHVLYFGENKLLVAVSDDLKSWGTLGGPISYITKGRNEHISIMNLELTDEGIIVFYFQFEEKRHIKSKYCLKAAFFDKDKPNKLLWDLVIWKQQGKAPKDHTQPIGVTLNHDKLLSYWQHEEEKIFVVIFPRLKTILKEIKPSFISPAVKKYKKNPILKPIKHHYWESQAVFNPAAFFDEGEVHIVYRAVGDNNISTLGYAASKDGYNIDKRYKHPIYVPTNTPDNLKGQYRPDKSTKHLAKQYATSSYVSGPGYGGCEDPRITKIENKLYMTYVAFDGFNPPRVALTSTDASDFHNKDWNWSKPIMLSHPNEAHKNWVVFPEKINGKFAVLHSVTPSILIDYLDTLDLAEGTYICSHFSPEKRKNVWDSRIRGVGPPPIKTKDGWLLFYHAMDDNDPGRYKLGAMLLDTDNPEVVKYRASAPILEPDEAYENSGFKAGVVYACGAVVKDERLFLYYGASDTSSAVATADINIFLKELKESHRATLVHTNSQNIKPVLH